MLSDNQLAALCQREIEQARRYTDRDLAGDRRTAIEYFNGEMRDLPAEENRSSAVSTDIADVIGWAMPGLQRIFGGSDQIVEYEPSEPTDQAYAEQVTEYINYIFQRDCDGYRVIYDAMFDALLLRTGWVKHWWHVEDEEKVETYTGLDDDTYTALAGEDEVEVLEHDEREIELGEGLTATVHDCRLKRTREVGKIKLECPAPEDIFYDGVATSMDDLRFIAHRVVKPRSDLIQEGYSRTKVDALPTYIGTGEEGDVEESRDQDGDGNIDAAADKAMETVEVFECYIKADRDENGVAMWHKVVTGGGSKQLDPLDVEEWGDELPFTCFIADPIPHRFEGRSLADEVIDQQRIKTVLMRQTLDNLYLLNTPEREVVAEHIINPAQLSEKKPGNAILVREPGAIRDLAVPFVAQNSFAMLDYCDSVIEKRTGVSRATMALDPDALQNQTATAVNAAKDASHSKIELVARNFAEGGMKRLFRCLLKLVVANQDAPRMIRLRNEFVQMDPRGWNADMDVTVNTGLGTGSRERDLSMLNLILNQQIGMMDRAAGIGAQQIVGAMVPLIRNTLAKMVNAAGFKNPDMYFPEVGPEIMQALQQAGQGGQDAEAQVKMQKAQADMQIEQTKMQADVQLQRERMQMEMQIEREKLEMHRQAKMREMQLEAELAAMKAQQGGGLNQTDVNIRGSA